MQDLPQPIGVRLDRGYVAGELRVDDALAVAGPVELDDVHDELVHIHVAQLDLRRAGVIRKRVHHRLHGFDLLDDRTGQPVECFALVGLHLAEILVTQPFRRQLDWRQRVLDLVSEPPRHLAPGGVALGLDEIRNVVEDNDVACEDAAGCRQRRPAAHQYLSAARPGERDLLAPVAPRFGVAVDLRHVGLQGLLERLQIGKTLADFIEGFPGLLVQLDAKNLARRLVAGEQSAVLVQGQHAGGQPRQHGLQISSLVLHLLLTTPRLVPGPRQAPCHVIE